MPDGDEVALFDVHPHLGLTSLAAVAVGEGHEVTIYDPKREVRFGRHSYDGEFYLRAADDILALRPDAVGFTTLGCSLLFAARVAELLKARVRDLPILVGGPHATILDRLLLETYSQFDLVVRHEAEETLPPVLASLERRAFESIPGITWRAGRGRGIRATPGRPMIEDLDRLPIPLYDLYPVEELGLDLMRVEAGRGCPFACTFCSTASFFQRSYRLKSPERIVREMDLLHSRFGATEFKLDHDLFTVDRRKVLAFCEAVEDRTYLWRVSARTDCVDEELLRAMARSGCIGLYFGIETGSSRMQRIAQKRLKLAGVRHILDAAEHLGIETTVSFITGFPDETREDQDETLDMLGECFARPQGSCIPQLHILTPEPGTGLFSTQRDSLAYDAYTTKFNARLIGGGDREQILAHRDLYSTYYYYPAAMPRSVYTFAVDAIDALRATGHEVLTYAVRCAGGRLSALIASFRDWAWEKRRGARVDSALATEFFANTFGAGHHLTSLFRFGVAMNLGVSSRTMPGVSSDANGHGHKQPDARRYALNPSATILPDLHDCGSLLGRIREFGAEARMLDDVEAGDRACCVIVRDGDHAVSYRINQGAESVLSLFESPRSIAEVSTLLDEVAPGIVGHEEFLAEIAELGVLVPATPGARGVAGTPV
jgi:radical SAM superfamily enzyme YgiQ (UPF0313 family)